MVSRTDGKDRVCLDPEDLNNAIRWAFYELPTTKDVASKFHNTKVFKCSEHSNGFLAC